MPLLRRMQQQQQLQARRHSPIDAEINAIAVTSSPYKSRRVTKKASISKSNKTESPIYRIMPLESKQQERKSKNRN
jgi:hypothetical protein